MIAALFVQKNGAYWNLPDVDPWDIERDALGYTGPYPVVAHPPCSRWCRLSGLVQARYGYKIGDDGGCFKFALDAVRKFGGVLEHPAYSKAWAKYNLPIPPRSGGWMKTFCGGWVCHVEQIKYGHAAKKATWIYAFGVDLPSLRWGSTRDCESDALVSRCGNHITERAMVSRLRRGNPKYESDKRRRLGSKEASATPIEFRDILIRMAESANE